MPLRRKHRLSELRQGDRVRHNDPDVPPARVLAVDRLHARVYVDSAWRRGHGWPDSEPVYLGAWGIVDDRGEREPARRGESGPLAALDMAVDEVCARAR